MLALVRSLQVLTLSQVEAARSLDGAHLAELNARRADLQFQLEVELSEGPKLSDDDRIALREAASDLQLAEQRLARLVGIVNQTLAIALPSGNTTYGRKGRMAG